MLVAPTHTDELTIDLKSVDTHTVPLHAHTGKWTNMMTEILRHPRLGRIKGRRVTDDLVQFRSLPYACIPRRFARSTPLDRLPQVTADELSYHEAVSYGPCSVQPEDSIATDLRWNQLPEYPGRAQSQSEDCLRITLTCPAARLNQIIAKPLPVVIFIHGGALMIGAGNSNTLFYLAAEFCC